MTLNLGCKWCHFSQNYKLPLTDKPCLPAVHVSSSSKWTSPPIPSPGWKAWASTPRGPSNGKKSPWASTERVNKSGFMGKMWKSDLHLKKIYCGFSFFFLAWLTIISIKCIISRIITPHADLLLRAKEMTISALPWLTLMNLSGAAALHIFRAERKDRSKSSLFMSGVCLVILHASERWIDKQSQDRLVD